MKTTINDIDRTEAIQSVKNLATLLRVKPEEVFPQLKDVYEQIGKAYLPIFWRMGENREVSYTTAHILYKSNERLRPEGFVIDGKTFSFQSEKTMAYSVGYKKSWKEATVDETQLVDNNKDKVEQATALLKTLYPYFEWNGDILCVLHKEN